MRMNKEEKYNLAVEFYQEGKYAEAVSLLTDGNRRWPKDADSLMLLSGCFNGMHKFSEAATLLMQAEKLEPDDPQVAYNLGYSLICMGRLTEGFERLEKCLKLNPPKEIRKMASRMIRSKKEFIQDAYDSSNISFEQDIACYNKFLYARDILYSPHPEKAIPLYEEILTKKPDHASSIHNIGLCYLRMGRPEEAIPFFEKASELDRADILCFANLSQAYSMLGNEEKSEYYANKLLEKEKHPAYRDGVKAVAALISAGNLCMARKFLEQYGSERDQLTFFSGVIYANDKDYKSASKEFCKLRGEYKIADDYYKKACELRDGKPSDSKFEPVLIEWNIEMV